MVDLGVYTLAIQRIIEKSWYFSCEVYDFFSSYDSNEQMDPLSKSLEKKLEYGEVITLEDLGIN